MIITKQQAQVLFTAMTPQEYMSYPELHQMFVYFNVQETMK